MSDSSVHDGDHTGQQNDANVTQDSGKIVNKSQDEFSRKLRHFNVGFDVNDVAPRVVENDYTPLFVNQGVNTTISGVHTKDESTDTAGLMNFQVDTRYGKNTVNHCIDMRFTNEDQLYRATPPVEVGAADSIVTGNKCQ